MGDLLYTRTTIKHKLFILFSVQSSQTSKLFSMKVVCFLAIITLHHVGLTLFFDDWSFWCYTFFFRKEFCSV